MRRSTSALGVLLVVAGLTGGCSTVDPSRFACRERDNLSALILAAQAVPTATLLPCLDTLLTGWRFAGSEIVDGSARFWLASDRAGMRAVRVELLPDCDVTSAVEVPPSADEAGTRRFESPISLEPSFAADRFYTFPGGCVKVEFRFGVSDPRLVLEADQALSFRPRAELVERLQDLGLILCGAGAAACPGGG